MPSYFFEIPDVGTTVQKVVTDNVTKNVLLNMGIVDADVIYEGSEYEEQSQAGSTTGEKRKVSFGSAERIIVSVEETRDALSRIERGAGFNLEVPFFHDKKHGIVLTPSMVKYDVTVSVRLRAPSKAAVQTWCNEVQRKTDMGKDLLETQAEFYYRIPVPALNLLNECYKTMHAHTVPLITLQDYFRQNFANNVTITSNLSGSVTEFAVRNTELRILGIFDTDGPKERKGDKFTAWECEFTFKFNYHRPEAVEAFFPVMLNNNLVSDEWWPTYDSPGLVDMTDGKGTAFTEAVGIFNPPYIRLPIYVPECDQPLLPTFGIESEIVKLALIHLTMKPSITPPNLLFALNDITEALSFSPALLEYVKDSYRSNPNGTDSFFKAVLYENQTPVDPSKVAISEDLNIYYNGIVYRERTYRVILQLDLGLATMTNEGFEILRAHLDVLEMIIEEFARGGSKVPFSEAEIKRGKLSPKTLDDIITVIVGSGNGTAYNGSPSASARLPITIHNNTILSYRRPS